MHDAPGSLDAVDPRHLQVHQYHVGQDARGHIHRLLPTRRLSHQFRVGQRIEQDPQPVPEYRVVIYYEYTYAFHISPFDTDDDE